MNQNASTGHSQATRSLSSGPRRVSYVHLARPRPRGRRVTEGPLYFTIK